MFIIHDRPSAWVATSASIAASKRALTVLTTHSRAAAAGIDSLLGGARCPQAGRTGSDLGTAPGLCGYPLFTTSVFTI